MPMGIPVAPVPKITVITASGTFTKDTRSRLVRVRAVGGGGGGNVTAGGGSGGYVEKFIPAASLGATETVTIGAGGVSGGVGGATSFGAFCTAGGGQSGGGAAAGNTGGDLMVSGSLAVGSGGAASRLSGTSPNAGLLYGGGGGGTGPSAGAAGVIIVEEFF